MVPPHSFNRAHAPPSSRLHGRISYREFQRATAAIATNLTAGVEEFHAQVWALWSSFDKDNDGEIRAEELQEITYILSRVHDRPVAPGGKR